MGATATKSKKLLPGSHARIYRDGTVLEGLVLVPDGLFVVRHLAPGSYVARDESGGSVEFAVGPGTEDVVIQGGEFDGHAAGPGTANVTPAPPADPDPELTFPKRAPAQKVQASPQADAPVLGEPGSAKIVPSGDSELPFPDDHPAVVAEDSPQPAVAVPPKDLDGDKTEALDEPESGQPTPVHSMGREGTPALVAAAGPHAPMPDASGDEPEDVPVDAEPATQQGRPAEPDTARAGEAQRAAASGDAGKAAPKRKRAKKPAKKS